MDEELSEMQHAFEDYDKRLALDHLRVNVCMGPSGMVEAHQERHKDDVKCNRL